MSRSTPNLCIPFRGARWGAVTLLALAALTSALNIPSQAQSTRDPRIAAVTAGVREIQLPNGLRIITKEVHSAPVVNFSVWYRVGSRNEHTGITGVSHLLEHLMFKGTRRLRPGEISRTLFANGATFNAGTYYDATRYWATVAADRLELVVGLEADRMINSRIDASDLKSEMTVVRSELEGGENDPTEILSQAVAAAAFQSHPYQWPIIGWRKDVENVSRNAIYDYYRRYYAPNNAAVVVVGDFDTARVQSLIRKHFGAIPRSPNPPTVYTQEPPQRGERRVTIRRAGNLPIVQIAYRGPAARSADFYALDLLQMVLAHGRASRMQKSLRDKKLVTDVSAGAPTQKDPYLFLFTATAAPGVTAERLEAALRDEIERARSEAPTAEEMERAKNQIETSFVFQTDSVSEQAEQIGYYDSLIHWRYLDTYISRVRALRGEDVVNVARKYFVPEASTTGVFIPTSAGAMSGPVGGEASARVEKARPGDRAVPLPRRTRLAAPRIPPHRVRLANGIRVVFQENHSSPTVAIQASLAAGDGYDPSEAPGIADLAARCLTLGAGGRDANTFARELEGVGASLSTNTDELTLQVSGKALSRDLRVLLRAMSDSLRRPDFNTAEFEREQKQLLGGLELEADDPSATGNRAFLRSVYPEGHALRPPSLAELKASLTRLTADSLREFHSRQYGPGGMILVVSGDFRRAETLQSIEQLLGDWAPNPRARPLPSLDLPLRPARTREEIDLPDKSETSVWWGHAGLLRRSDKDFYATQVLNMILGGGGALNSRLGDEIRDRQGLAYDVFSFFDSNLYPGPFSIGLGANPANARRAATAIDREVERIRKSGVTPREVAETVSYLTGRFPQRLESNAGMATLLWQMEYFNLGSDYIQRYGDFYSAVTPAQVNAAAARHLHPDRASVIIAGPKPK